MQMDDIPEAPIDLSHVDTTDLLHELFGRFDHCAFIGMKNMMHEEHQYRRVWKGNTHTIAGLCQDLAMTAIASLETSQHRSGPLGDEQEDMEDDR